jgi:hypothetical protein
MREDLTSFIRGSEVSALDGMGRGEAQEVRSLIVCCCGTSALYTKQLKTVYYCRIPHGSVG